MTESTYSPYNGNLKVATFLLTSEGDRLQYEHLINSPSVTIIKEEFTYGGRDKLTPMTTIWYEQN